MGQEDRLEKELGFPVAQLVKTCNFFPLKHLSDSKIRRNNVTRNNLVAELKSQRSQFVGPKRAAV